MFFPLLAAGQVPDFATDQFYAIGGNSGNGISASARLFSYEATLSLVIEVRDKKVNIERENDENTDHIEVWFALPRTAYPSDFEYSSHADYISYVPEKTRGITEEDPRFFSVFSEYGKITTPTDFTSRYDYPRSADIRKDSLPIPERRFLKARSVPFGVVHFGLFPDGRDVIQYNGSDLELVEDALHMRFGDLTGGIDYIAEINEKEDGYTITARISPQALGFVQLPQMDKIRFMVDIADSGADPASPASVVLSSSSNRKPGVPSTFNQVDLHKPLKTSFGHIPADFLKSARLFPLFVYGNTEWILANVDVDGILYREQQVSQVLSEVKFSRVPYHFDITQPSGISVATLLMDLDHVNKLPTEKEFIKIGASPGKMLEVERVLNPGFPDGQSRRSRVFRFPDEIPGVIIRESSYLDPYGWGPCGDCVLETIHIRRITSDDVYDIMSINQGNGPDAFCEVGEFRFEGYYVNQMDWIQSGKILVVRLAHYNGKDQKRIKLSWEKDGSNPRVEWIR
ncbi:MAG: hypothetical protein R3C61_14195 [Bacteroidia bacterium]